MGILDALVPDAEVVYRAEIQFRDSISAGRPSSTDVIQAWIRSKAGVTDEIEIVNMMKRTYIDTHPDMTSDEIYKIHDMPFEEFKKLSEQVAADMNLQVFLRVGVDDALCIESRQVKSMLREAMSIQFSRMGPTAAKKGWGPSRKGAESFFRERVFVDPTFIPLTDENGNKLTVPTEVIQWIGHPKGIHGENLSTLQLVEVCHRAKLSFDVRVAKNAVEDLSEKNWAYLWHAAQENGLGAKRSQGFGRFDLVKWSRV